MSQQITCNFKALGKPKTYGNEGKTVTKFYCDIDTDSQYPSVAEFQFFGDKLNLNGIAPGTNVTVHYNISGRKTEYKKDGQTVSGFFQSLNAWKVEEVSRAQPAHQQPAQQAAAPAYIEDENLPF